MFMVDIGWLGKTAKDPSMILNCCKYVTVERFNWFGGNVVDAFVAKLV